MGLILGKNGSISSKEWVYDDKKAKGDYVITPLEETTILSYLGDKIEELEARIKELEAQNNLKE